MATTKSVAALTNYDADTPNNAGDERGVTRTITAFYEKVAADSNGSTLQIARVPMNATLPSVCMANDALTGATSVDIGLQTDQEPDVATDYDDDCIAQGVNIASGQAAWTELGFELRDLADINKKVWELCGLTTNPGGYARVTLTGDTYGTSTGTLAFKVQYAL